MPNKKQMTAAGLAGLAVFVGLTTYYYMNAARLSRVPDEHYPTYSRNTMENWIVEIANRYNCTPVEFTEKLVDSVLECTGQNATNPFFKDEVHEAIRSNLTFPTGFKPNPEGFRGTMMLAMSAFALCGFGFGGLGGFGLVLGVLVGLSALAKLLVPCVRSTTQQIFSSLNMYSPQIDFQQPPLELEEMPSSQSDRSSKKEEEEANSKINQEEATSTVVVTPAPDATPTTDVSLTIDDGSSTKEEDRTSVKLD